jgi:hypothetical protein
MGRFYRSFNGMCWPAPGPDLGDLSYVLTYGQPTKEQLLVCASVINAYQHMIRLSHDNRAKVISELRLGPNGPEQAKVERPLTGCAADRDGECSHSQCPQLRDGEPVRSGRHCPLDSRDEDE